MARVRVQKVPTQTSRFSKREIYALLCYHYPQYTLREAANLPYRDVKLLIQTAEKKEAVRMYNLTQIAAAPHTKKGEGVKKLIKHFKNMAGDK